MRHLPGQPLVGLSHVPGAAALGAEVERHQGDRPRRFDRAPVTVDNTGDAEGLTTTLRSTDDAGFCTSVAIQFAPTTPVPLLEMDTRGVTFEVSRADSRRFLPAVVDLVTGAGFDPLAVPLRVVPWEEAAEAWLGPATKLVVERA